MAQPIPLPSLNPGAPAMYILRGLPGSGKSFLAEQINDKLYYARGRNAVICSADQYFCLQDGEYRFDATKLPQAHAWCQGRAYTALEMGCDVIIDNTNTRLWEMHPYLRMAQDEIGHLFILEPDTEWARDVDECARRNSHGVPRESIQRMLDRWEPYQTA